LSIFQKKPIVEIKTNSKIYTGWEEILSQLLSFSKRINKDRKIIIIEFYQGVFEAEIVNEISKRIKPELLITTASLYFNQDKIEKILQPYVTIDRIFGYMTKLDIDAFFDPEKVNRARLNISSLHEGTVLILGIGASCVSPDYDVLVYADMARWEIQHRMRNHEVSNIGVNNKDTEDWMLLYKQGYFVDWRVCDRLKKKLMYKWNFVLDTNDRNEPKLIEGKVVLESLQQCLSRPFSVAPFFDPGPWGGQWMKNVCDLDKDVENYAWCFNCVPEENSLLLKFGENILEIPSINLVFFDPKKLLGEAVYGRFGDEFPIRFDFLDTMDGGNLSLQVHPLTEYIQEKFGMHYTQDESYYIMDVKKGSVVYLGLKEGVNSEQMINDLETTQGEAKSFEVEKYIQTWPVKKHDHFLIPAGTVHCSGKDSVVLEISATPYIFTFKLWDWERLGLDGKPRQINIEHGKHVIQWDRDTSWSKKQLVNKIEKIAEGDGWMEEKTGLHRNEFIETRRHWFSKKVFHNTNDGVNVLNLVEGDEIVVESPANHFEPFVVHYAETFIVPACVGEYTIRPYGISEGKKCATIKAFVRTSA
jgi:mannose-6-phosphate isomerase class I